MSCFVNILLGNLNTIYIVTEPWESSTEPLFLVVLSCCKECRQCTIGLPLSEWRHHELQEERMHPQKLPSQAAQRTGTLLIIIQDTAGAQEVKWSFCVPTAIPIVVSSEGTFVAFFLEPHGDAATFNFSFHCLCCSWLWWSKWNCETRFRIYNNSVYVCSVAQSCLTFATPWTVACQVPLSMEFSRQEHWSGLPFPPPGDLSGSWIQPTSPVSPELADGFFTTEPPGKPHITAVLL